jgi:hypothetical protein
LDRDRFWMLIEQARTAGGDCELLTAHLLALLRELPVNAGCSDDGFEDFRGWLIAQARQVYQASLQDPDSLALHPQVRNLDPRRMWPTMLDCQPLLAAAWEAYRPPLATTGQEFPSEALPGRRETRGRHGTSTTMPRCASATPSSGPTSTWDTAF